MSVVASEDAAASNTMYNYMETLCSRDRLLLRQYSMLDLLRGKDYARSLIAPNQRLMFGHMTEHFFLTISPVTVIVWID